MKRPASVQLAAQPRRCPRIDLVFAEAIIFQQRENIAVARYEPSISFVRELSSIDRGFTAQMCVE
jgi:hypothetical protein